LVSAFRCTYGGQNRRIRLLSRDGAGTGGTARLLREAGIPVKDVAEVTGFPEMLDGRVKTLHPKIAGGILAIRSNAAHRRAIEEHGIAPIDMVVVNLYRFEDVAAKADARLEDLIENIDIGGPTMIRAAAKNYQDVAVVVSPADYGAVIEEMRKGGLSLETRWRLAKKAFRTTADYDAAISARLEKVDSASPLPPDLSLRAPKLMDLRYGENPHQAAALYGGAARASRARSSCMARNSPTTTWWIWTRRGNWRSEFSQPAAAIVKHTNPCGCAEQGSLAEAYRKAFECDPLSAYGGVIGFNRAVDEETAREVRRPSSRRLPRRITRRKRWRCAAAKKNLRLMRVAPGSIRWW
jgi:phosphoribosylaminoimidazolecarboxamide formyltransferase/IMP cyclohydrolase